MKENRESITQNRYATFQAAAVSSGGSGKVSAEYAHNSLTTLDKIMDRAAIAAKSFKDTDSSYSNAVSIMEVLIEKVQHSLKPIEPTLGQGPTR